MQMDICSHTGLSVTDNVNNLHGLCMNTLESTDGVPDIPSADELEVGVTEFLNIRDDKKEDSSNSPPSKSSEFQKKDLCDKSHKSKITVRAPENCLSKSASFPNSSKTLSSSSNVTTSKVSTHGHNVQPRDPSGFRSMSLPTHLKPVSAMKGSREKRGAAPPVKLTVKWAPEVYDPIPTSVSHVVTNNRPSKHSTKKNSRNKQKNASKSSSRGSKGKDKKQVRKRGGNSSSIGYKLPQHEEDEVVDFHEHEAQSGAIDFQIGNHDQFCGSSFYKRYETNLHLSSVAEAT